MEQNEKKVFHLKRDDIQTSLKETGRQYFIGDLKLPQRLPFINLGDLEIGSSLYLEPKVDKPHYHRISSEIIYVLCGEYRILLTETEEEYDLCAGDFFVLPPGVAYAGKAVLSGTQTFFVKCGGNDKVTVDVGESVEAWLRG